MRGICQRCHRPLEVSSHHIVRRNNNRTKVVDVCHPCHIWIGLHPRLAHDEGFYEYMDSIYRPKRRKLDSTYRKQYSGDRK